MRPHIRDDTMSIQSRYDTTKLSQSKPLVRSLEIWTWPLTLHIDLWGSTACGKAKITHLQTEAWSWWADYRYKRTMWPQTLRYTERGRQKLWENRMAADALPVFGFLRLYSCLDFVNSSAKTREVLHCSYAGLQWFFIFDSQTQEPSSPSRRLWPQLMEARKSECQGTVSVHRGL